MRADLLRKKFLEYFESKKHRIIESDSLVPRGDPTVLFTPAGMNQFKKQFLGFTAGFSRAASSQRCLRTDDLDKVGRTSGHHTFFEMLGNFSFGDYFKKETISLAWEFLTGELGINKERLWVSVYKDDDEAYSIWRNEIKIPEDRIIRLGDKENFWPSEAKQKGPNGPCGPCSEIFFDWGKAIGCGRVNCDPACGCGRFVEVWNLVFTQFNRKEGGILEPLPRKNIDTGMGLERLAAVMQGVYSNFETDLFRPLVEEIASKCQGVEVPEGKALLYAVADHIRAITFAIYDGVLPSNEGRGYVVRKLIRKGVLHLKTLGLKKPFLYKLVPLVADIMRDPYPDLESRRENIAEIILAEERNFITILDSGQALLKEKFSSLSEADEPEKIGTIAFQLYDTYGMPLEITQDWLRKEGFKNLAAVVKVVNRKLQEQKGRSKMQSAMRGDVFEVGELQLGAKKTRFLGYKKYETRVKIIKIVKDHQLVKKVVKGEEARVILDKTVFYAEAGGQIGDSGELIKGKNIFSVLDTKRFEKVSVHIGRVKDGSFRVGDELKAVVDSRRRLAIARNHTATHLLQAALRKILGAHVKQQGSLVAEDRLRFDFTHFKDIDNNQLRRIEDEVNDYVLNDIPVSSAEMPLRLAKKKGALAFFGEKYEDKVRVVTIGAISKELCAGTHLERTSQTGLFKIIQEGSVASGVRRIEAVTGKAAYHNIEDNDRIIEEAQAILKVGKDRIVEQLETRLARLKNLEKQGQEQRIGDVRSSLDKLIQGAEIINNIKVITEIIPDANMDVLRKAMDSIRQNQSSCVAALGGIINGRAILVMGITPDLLGKGWDVTEIIPQVARVIGGSGGGRKDFAQAGGGNPGNFPQAFAELKKIIQGKA